MLEDILDELPDQLHALLEEVPLIVEDEPGPALLREMELDPRDTLLCGLHWGVALTDRSVEHTARMPDRMMLFREPIFRVAGYTPTPTGRERLEHQIHVTLLHEIGHHFGLDEDDLAALGYG